MRILGFDPGITNFAYGVYEDGRVVDFGWVRGHDVNECDWFFLESVLDIFARVRPDRIAIERFAFRQNASVASEAINQMIGKVDLLARTKGYAIDQIMPSHWKVKLKTKDLAAGAKGLFPDVTFDAIHQADACGIARYTYEKYVAAELKELAKQEKKAKKAKKAK